jgi:hypothetical protein
MRYGWVSYYWKVMRLAENAAEPEASTGRHR